MSNFKFSIIISAYNSAPWISKSIKSIISQTLDFKSNTEIILINNGSTDGTHAICEEYGSKYPKNITYLNKKHEGRGKNRNIGLEHACGQYVMFLDGENYISKNTLRDVLKLFEEHSDVEIVTTMPVYLDYDIKDETYLSKYLESRVINLLEYPEFMQVQTISCFFKKAMFDNVTFSDELKLSEDLTIINQKLIDNPKLAISSNSKYYIRAPYENKSLLNVLPNSKDFDNVEIKYPLKSLIDYSLKKYNRVPGFIQNTLLHYFNEVIPNEKIHEKLTKEEIANLNEKIKDILHYIDDDYIYNKTHMDVKIKTFLLFIKNEYSYSEKDKIKLTKQLKLDTVFIDIYQIIDDDLYILANINSISSYEHVDVYVNDERIETDRLEFPQREKYYLNEKYLSNNTFEFHVRLEENKKYALRFESDINEELHIDFSRPCNFSKVVGYAKTKKYLSVLENDRIMISKTKTGTWLKMELKALKGMVMNRVPGFETAVPIRMMYMVLYPFLKNRRIWFYMDFPTIADDNGMHLFKYSVNQNDKGIKKYFIIDKSSADHEKMKKIGPVIAYHSIKHRVLGLFTEKIITSHPDNNYIYAFWGHYPNFAGILKSSTIFLQHGITLNNISGWLNKYDKNLDFLLTASKKEYDSLFKYYYNYDEEIIQLLGFPRFDNLKDGKTKTILLMPSWRRYLNNENKYTISNSSYFKTYNSLINNERLIEKAKEYGYEIIFRPHPHVYEFVDLFDENEYIKIDFERGSYQELFKKGALLITDYSSVAFDFAYLKKPVLYYHYGEDYHFNLEESYFDYNTMGFGEVCRSEDEIVDFLEEYMKNDCRMKEKHVENVERYFTFTDTDNCMRVHEAIKKIPPRD